MRLVIQSLLFPLVLLITSCNTLQSKTPVIYDNGVVGVHYIEDITVLEVKRGYIKEWCGAGGACANKKLRRIVITPINGVYDYETIYKLGEEVCHLLLDDKCEHIN
jgi:hypothetical protein